LPNKEFVDVKVQMNTAQKQMYEKLRNELYLLVEKNDTTVIDNSNVVLKRLLRLIQIASNPRLVDDLYGEMSCKETKLRQLLEEIISKNEKAIVWTNYIENVDYLSTRNKDLGSVKIHGKMPISDRYKSIKSFKENPKIHLLFATPASSKEGLTLTVANHVIFFDRSLSLDDYLQAQDRIHRISQQKTCYIYNIIAEDTIDVWVDSLLKAKENAAHLVQGDCSVEEYSNRISYNFGQIVKEILKGDNINE
jgi:SNF2 family DNA or RNA helicase